MRSKRKPSAGDDVPIVTYSRLPSDRPPAPDDDPHALREAEPWLDGIEVPLVERQGRPRAAPDIRAAAYDDPPAAPAKPDPFASPPRRPRRLLMTVAAIAAVAILAGFAVLAVTFHAATTVTAEAPAAAKDPQAEIADLQKQIDALANSSGPSSAATRAKIAELEQRLADLSGAQAPAVAATPAVRSVSTDATAAEPVPPPRARPVKKEARAVPEDKPAAATPVAKAVVPVTAVVETPAARVEPKVASVPTGHGKTGEAGPSSDADFIARVEKALADAPPDQTRPVAAAPAAPAAVAPSAGLAPADEEPAGMPMGSTPPARVNALGAAGAAPSDIGPAVRVIPSGGGASADARPLPAAPRAAPPAAAAPAALDIRPVPGTPVPPEPIPNVQ